MVALTSIEFESVDADLFDENGRPVSGSGEKHRGQVRMAYRLAAAYRDRLLHVHGIGWFAWTGKRWERDERRHARRAVLDVLRDALGESLEDQTLRADVARCESDNGIEGVLGVASSLVEFAATVDDLDADPHLLNVANGTLDLRTMQLRAHDPADRLTKVTRGGYVPSVGRAVWMDFLTTVLPDEEVRGYVQRLAGQALHGRVGEHLFPVWTGTGANGKGTAYGAINFALGDYAISIDPDLLLQRDRGAHPTGLMDLRGVRWAVASETNDGRKLDEALMKRLTGGDPIRARYMHRDFVEFEPQHQLVYVTNHLPGVRGDDPATWRRVRVVPFDVVVPPDQRDPGLPERLQLEADAVLTWAVEGYLDYAAGGMAEPAAVMARTDAYRQESDDVARFITERCHLSPAASTGARELYAAWQRWAQTEGAEPMSEKAFGKEIDRLGYEKKRTGAGIRRAGLMLLAEDEDGGVQGDEGF